MLIVALIAAVVGFGLAAWFWSRNREAARRATVSEARVATLSKYEVIEDAEARAAKITADAEGKAQAVLVEANAAARRTADEARARAEQVQADAAAARAKAEAEAAAMTSDAKETAKEYRERAGIHLKAAEIEAERIYAEARRKAEQIAGDALGAKENADKWASTASAMRNVVEGYGDRYLVPAFSLLDELADEFGFEEGGQKLKAARERSRRLIKEGRAADCDYVEANRKETAIAFVADAFNGKVDTILSGVRRDNFGTLQQKVNDAYALVNHLGEAFRNARITEEYRDARLDELRWAVVVHELREKDKEEQRAMRERIREEERAQREFERAMKEAAKEEELLLKARQKIEAEIGKASDEQRAKYEAQLAELNERLKAAEEKNQRAMSMAQQTRAGHVYVISNEGSFGENIYKVGLTRRLDPEDRIKELGDASVPFEFDIHAMIRSDDAPALECELHKRFVAGQVNKVNPRKEFFRVKLQEIRAEVERLGLSATWTMTAAAADYRETLAIERAIEGNALDVKHWTEKQLHAIEVNENANAYAAKEPAV
jgi:hypothetical protein